jgi:hypothetical protein
LKFFVFILLAAVLMGCAQRDPYQTTPEPPPSICRQSIDCKIGYPDIYAPVKPACVNEAAISRPFDSQLEFNHCSRAIKCYENLLNEWLNCAKKKKLTAVEELWKEAKSRYLCRTTGAVPCPTDDPAEKYWGVPGMPFCLRKSKVFSKFSPNKGRCKADLDAYQWKLENSAKIKISEARSKAEEELSRAVRNFNCRAKGEKGICF